MSRQRGRAVLTAMVEHAHKRDCVVHLTRYQVDDLHEYVAGLEADKWMAGESLDRYGIMLAQMRGSRRDLRATAEATVHAYRQRNAVVEAAKYARDEVSAGRFTSFQFEQHVCAALEDALRPDAK